MNSKKVYTTSYYASRCISYRTSAGLGYECIVIFHSNKRDDFNVFERNNNTGYCKDALTGKRISAKIYEDYRKTTQYAL